MITKNKYKASKNISPNRKKVTVRKHGDSKKYGNKTYNLFSDRYQLKNKYESYRYKNWKDIFIWNLWLKIILYFLNSYNNQSIYQSFNLLQIKFLQLRVFWNFLINHVHNTINLFYKIFKCWFN